MEEEIRFYYSLNEYENLLEKLFYYDELNFEGCFHEITSQYDHPMKECSFYSKQIDGRFRVRSSRNVDTNDSYAKISWKSRIPGTKKGLYNVEEEKEVNFEFNDLDNLGFILDNVLKLKMVESYERYRNVFANADIEIVVDKYPFGIALEIENKSKEKTAKDTISYWTEKIGLRFEDAYRLSWDDKYKELCKEQNVEESNIVKFGIPMPRI